MVTGYSSVEHAVEAMHLGALDYIPKPVNPVKLKEVIARALSAPGMSSNAKANKSIPDRYIHFDEIIGKSKPLKQILKRVQEISDIDVPVLISGESGTGKELFARAIHKSSARKENSFVAVNTGAISKDLILSELFGHEKGSFTGAVDRKQGKFEEADGGTLFLDEISSMSESVQIALLRVLESRVITRVGGSGEIPVDVRIIAATNRDLTRMIAEERFRDDLYYRLNVYNIELPPLRDREEDIMLIARSYLAKFNKEYNRNVKDFDQTALNIMQSYTWPGNIRELRNVVLRSMIESKDLIRKKNLPRLIQKGGQPGQEIRFPAGTPLPEIERASIIETLKLVRGNKLKAAEMLGLSRRSLYNKLEEYEIEEHEYK
jgi:two-component system response regulator HydG